MSRIAATFRTDVRLQHRNGFYYAVVFVLVLFAVLISQLPSFDWTPWLAPMVLGNLTMVSFFFVGGLVLLEKAEGTLEAQVVTPLRIGEYLGSKVATLAALSWIENTALVSMAGGLRYDVLLLTAGILGASVIYSLVGFVTVARYDSINEYIMPATLVTVLLSIPFLDYFEIWGGWLMLLHPLQGSLIFLKGAFLPVSAGELMGAALSTTTWIMVCYLVSRRTFRRFLVRKEGTR